MKKVLVTGARGFIGKNLIVRLKTLKDICVYEYDIDDTQERLEDYLKEVDFVYHLAGVNRTKDAQNFTDGNAGFTHTLINSIERLGRKLPILFSSSIQAELENPYGISKRTAEEEILNYYIRNSCEIYIYRLQNVFGKWCKPNYNSVVATFSYNISHDMDIWVSDPEKKLTLVYIDDVVDSFIAHIMNEKIAVSGYCSIDKTYEITLQELIEKLRNFRNIRTTSVVPDFSDDLTRYLYATYLSYLDKQDFSYKTTKLEDNRGWLTELLKSKEFGQIFVSKSHKGILRGNHYHNTKVEKFIVIQGEAVIRFRKIEEDSVIDYYVSGDYPEVVDIPPGYTHSIENIGKDELITLFWSSEIFNSDKLDTYFCEV